MHPLANNRVYLRPSGLFVNRQFNVEAHANLIFPHKIFVYRIAAIVAGVSFVQGAAWNAPVTRDTAPLCYYLKDGVFRRAAVLSLAAAVFGIKSYIMLRAAAAVEPKPDGQQPQPQQAPAAPVVTGYPPQGYAPNQQFTAAADQVYGQGPSALYPPTKGYGQV